MINQLIVSIIVPLVLTIIIEVLLAFVFLRVKDDCRIVVLAQCITNPIVNLAMEFEYFFEKSESLFLLGVLEIGAVIIEAIIYRRCFSEKNKSCAINFSILANAASFLIGFVMFWNW